MDKKIAIIVPSFKDAKILKTIKSIKNFDDMETVKILIVDGGSGPELLDECRALLGPDDHLVSEPDKGIFDALNKGLEAVDTVFMGWLGSDDLFAADFKASDVLRDIGSADILVASTAHFKGTRITRYTRSWPAGLKLYYAGLNNPHFSTFGKSEVLRRARFDLELRAADIDYFLNIFDTRPVVATTSKVSTLMAEGGFSNGTLGGIATGNRSLLPVYGRYWPRLLTLVPIVVKLVYRVVTLGINKVRHALGLSNSFEEQLPQEN